MMDVKLGTGEFASCSLTASQTQTRQILCKLPVSPAVSGSERRDSRDMIPLTQPLHHVAMANVQRKVKVTVNVPQL